MTPNSLISILICDECGIGRNLSKTLVENGYKTIQANRSESVLQLFDSHCPEVTLINIDLPDNFGLDILREIKKIQPTAAVIAVTDNLLTEKVILAFRLGANDVIAKPLDAENLLKMLAVASESKKLSNNHKKIQKEQPNAFTFDQIIGESPVIKETISMARKVADSDVSCVLLQGESGTGKDLFAKAIHYSSDRAHKPFVAINCAAIPANLLESELFGFEKGAFTDAKSLKKGLFEQAEGGTLFLDEIGELDIGLQVKLLRILEERTFRRVGGVRDLPLNVRVIAASNRNLKVESENNQFREDLYYRLSIIQIELPPLRQRGDDILLIAEFFIKRLDKKWHQTPVRKLSPELKEAIRRYRWKGNVRELRNVIERALILEEKEIITMKYMPEEISANCYINLKHSKEEMSKASLYFSLPPEGISLDMVEKWLIEEALQRSGGNVTRASEMLKVSRDRIRYRLKKNKISG